MTKETVMYKGTQYIILYKYESGYYEIKELDSNYVVKLVHKSDLEYQ
jgi:hypothetical protein